MFRQILATLLLAVVLLSSCSVKRGIKVLFDMPMKMERVAATAGHFMSSTSHSASSCLKCADFQVLTADSFDQSLIKNLTPAVLISIVFSLFLLPFFRPEETPPYGMPSLVRSIPKYLLFSKLLFYDLR